MLHARAVLGGTLIALAASSLGCFRIEETTRLKANGSGETHVEISFPQPAMRWLPGKPTEAWVKPNLPRGVQLTSFVNRKGKTAYTDPMGKEHEMASEIFVADLKFDNVTSLNRIRVRPDSRNAVAELAGAAPGKGAMMAMKQTPQTPDSGPFQTLTFREEDGQLHFRRVIQKARSAEAVRAERMSRPGSKSKPQVFDLANSHWTITIECPGKVAKHNATRADGSTLTWEFDLRELQRRQDRDWTVEFSCRRD